MAKKAHGTTIRIATTSNGSYVNITGIIEVTLPTISKDTIESVHYNSNSIKKFRGGLVDTGEISFTTLDYIDQNDINDDHMSHSFENLLKNDNTIFVRYSTPDDNTQFQASGIVTSVETLFSKDDVLKKEITIKLTSNITQIG